jgi:hypothetical protein
MRKCSCIRCKAKDYVLSIYPAMNGQRALLIAEKITKALHEGLDETAKRFPNSPADREGK